MTTTNPLILSSDDLASSDLASRPLEAADVAISIHLIADKIFDSLDLTDLRRLRELNKSWAIASSNEISKRRSWHLHFDIEEDDKNGGTGRLSNFNLMLENRSEIFKNLTIPFPITGYTFVGDLNPNHETFFKICGHLVKILVLNFHDRTEYRQREFVPIFLKQCSNTEALTLTKFDYAVKNNDSDNPQIEFNFPSLQKLSCYDSYPNLNLDSLRSSLIFKILAASPNLKVVEDLDIKKVLNLSILSGKPHLVKNIEIRGHQDLTNIVKLVKLVDQLDSSFSGFEEPKFEVPAYARQQSNAVSKILELCNKSLETFWLNPQRYVLDFVQWPKMEALTVFQIETSLIDPWMLEKALPIFSQNLMNTNLNETFPRLHTVKLDALIYEDLDTYFPPIPQQLMVKGHGAFHAVQSLSMDVFFVYQVTRRALKRIRALFPNLRNLKVTGGPSLKCLRHIFHTWSHRCQGSVGVALLERLEFWSSHHSEDLEEDNQWPDCLASVLTGISKENCAWLMENSLNDQKREEDVDVHSLRTSASICDLVGLQWFKLVLVEDWQKNDESLAVIKEYAFDLMPDLTVVS